MTEQQKWRKWIIAIAYICIFGGCFLYLALICFTSFRPKCIFYENTGLLCLTCGTTKMFLALFQGDVMAAFNYNQFMFFAIPLLLLLCIYLSWSYYKYGKIKHKKILLTIAVAIVIIAVIFFYWRNFII